MTLREQEVLRLMAEGRSNTSIARSLVVSNGAVEKYIGSIFTKPCCRPTVSTIGARVLAVPRYLSG